MLDRLVCSLCLDNSHCLTPYLKGSFWHSHDEVAYVSSRRGKGEDVTTILFVYLGYDPFFLMVPRTIVCSKIIQDCFLSSYDFKCTFCQWDNHWDIRWYRNWNVWGHRGCCWEDILITKRGFWDDAILTPVQGLRSMSSSNSILLDLLDDDKPCPMCPLLCFSI